MDARHLKLQSVCNRYGDPMIPEYRSHTLVPPKDSFIINPKTRIALCGLDGLAKKSFKALFDRIRSAADKWAFFLIGGNFIAICSNNLFWFAAILMNTRDGKTTTSLLPNPTKKLFLSDTLWKDWSQFTGNYLFANQSVLQYYVCLVLISENRTLVHFSI